MGKLFDSVINKNTKYKKGKSRLDVPFEHIKLLVYTSGQVLNAVWTAVANGLDHWHTFLHYVVPVGMTARLVFRTPMRLKLYNAGGTEQGRAVQMMLGLQKVGKSFVTEICPIPYSQWYDLAWVAQMNQDNRDSLVVDLGGYGEVIFYEQEHIVFQVKNSTIDIPSTPHVSTLIEYPIQVITNAELGRALQRIKTEEMKARGIDRES